MAYGEYTPDPTIGKAEEYHWANLVSNGRTQYMTGTLEHQIEKILKSNTSETAVEQLTMLFRERERLQIGHISNQSEQYEGELADAYEHIDHMSAAMRVINVLSHDEDSKLMNAITIITDVYIQEEE